MKQRTHANRGRTRLDVLATTKKRMVAAARDLRSSATLSERSLWEALRDRRLDGRKFRRQQPFGPFVLDFYCASERLAVEIDGSVHDGAEQQRADAERQSVLEDLDIRIVRVPASMVERDLEGALSAIRRKFKQV